MAEDWAVDVRKYAPDADGGTIAAIVRYCGIALQSRDASLVSFTDPVETGRVRDNFCRKKLALTDPDADIDAAIARVGERMRGDSTRNRVTVYYLLAEAYGKLGLFGGAGVGAAGAAAVAATAVAGTTTTPQPAVSAPPAEIWPARGVVSLPPAATTTVQGLPRAGGGSGVETTAALGCGVIAAVILGTAIAAALVTDRAGRDPLATASASAVTIAPAARPARAPVPALAIPTGSGVVAQEVAGKPLVSVYFDTAKTDVSPDFATIAAPVKAWVDAHAGARLAVSGFNDPRGNAAFNAELSKNRAKAVAAALAAIGVPSASVDLVKPPETTDTGTTPVQARRVDIVVHDAS